MSRLRQVARSETDDPIVLSMYDLLFGKDVDPMVDRSAATATGSTGDWWTTYALVPDIMEHAVGGFVLYRSPDRKLDGVLRELAQARIGWAVGSKFVYSQHVQALRGLGADAAKIDGLTAGRPRMRTPRPSVPCSRSPTPSPTTTAGSATTPSPPCSPPCPTRRSSSSPT